MNIYNAIEKLGLNKVLLSIFPNLNGIDFNQITYNKDKIDDLSLDSFSETTWNFGIGSGPMIFRSFDKKSVEIELKKLLNKNSIDSSSKISVVENMILAWNGNGFKIQKIENKDRFILLITKEDVKPENESSKETDIHPLSSKINSSILGFDKNIYKSNKTLDNNKFYSKTNEAIDIESNSKEINEQISFLKKIVFEYSPEDDFLRIKNDSIKKWIDNSPKETILFNIESKCQIIFSKDDNNYKLNIFPPGGISGSWDSLNEGDFIEEKPIVKFSSPVDLIKPLKSEDYETPINIDLEEEIEDDDIEFEDPDDFINDSVDNEYSEKKSSQKSNFSFSWIYIFLSLLFLLVLLRYCNTTSRDGAFYYDRGLSYYESGDRQRALRDFDRSIQVDESFIDSYIKRADIYIDQEEYYEAIYDLNEIIINDDNNWIAYYLRGKAYYLRASSSNASKYSPDYQRAIDDFSKSISLNPLKDNSMSYIFRGLTYKLIQSELACDDFYSACSFGISQACELIEEDCYPKTGSMPYEKKFGSGLYGGGNDYIIDNLNGDYDRLVSIRRADTRFIVRAVFIRSGDSYTINNLPSGIYILEDLRGNNWTPRILRNDGITKGGFLLNEQFSRYNFRIDLISLPKDRGFQYAAPDGNITSDEISENEFFN